MHEPLQLNGGCPNWVRIWDMNASIWEVEVFSRSIWRFFDDFSISPFPLTIITRLAAFKATASIPSFVLFWSTQKFVY